MNQKVNGVQEYLQAVSLLLLTINTIMEAIRAFLQMRFVLLELIYLQQRLIVPDIGVYPILFFT